MGEEGAKPGMTVHGNEYHDPDFEQEGAAAGLVEAHRTTEVHTQDQPPAEHGNEKHNPDFAEVAHTHSDLSPAHKGVTTGVHGVGAGIIAKVGDIAVDGNLSAAAQDAIAKKHTRNTDKAITDADGDTAWDVEQSADEDKIHGKVKGVEAFLLDDAGILTLAKQAMAKGRAGTANQWIPTAATYIPRLLLDTEDADNQSEMNTRVVSGTADATEANYLRDADAGFQATDVGAAVWNTTDNTYTTVTSFISTGKVGVANNIFVSGEAYKLYHSRYTAKAAGMYLATASIEVQTIADGVCVQVLIRKNGSNVAKQALAEGGAVWAHRLVTALVPMSINDYLEVYVWQGAGFNRDTYYNDNNCFLAVVKVT